MSHHVDHQETLVALKEVLALVEQGDLVRNTTNDFDRSKFFYQAYRIISALKNAKAVIEKSEGRGAA